MPVETSDSLLELLRDSGLLEASQLEELTRLTQQRERQPKELAYLLQEKGWLTTYQVEQLLQGRGDKLILGPYLLLSLLGEGGMGQVFKALHRNLQRVVALKLLRPEQLSQQAVQERFRREARAAARLAHPNIVTLYDADQIGDSYFLAMEYVDGIDLGRLVQLAGPLPVGQACDYIRQAAMGLHHAHERGLVHRDVKPSNLLVMAPDRTAAGTVAVAASEGGLIEQYAGGVVKVLDMGIARVLAEASSELNLTQEGAVLGTVDYLSPEQATNSRSADRRADLYSLGCTFYHLLTGQTPFSEGNAFTRMVQHQMEEPRSVTSLRPDVPAEVVSILARLMAKKPEDRFQTGAEAASALSDFLSQSLVPIQVSSLYSDSVPSLDALLAARGLESADTSHGATALDLEAETPISRPTPSNRPRRWLRLAIPIGIAAAITIAMTLFRDPHSVDGQTATQDRTQPQQETQTNPPPPNPAPPSPRPDVDPLAGFIHPKTAALFTLNLRQMLDSPMFTKLHGPHWEESLRKGEGSWGWVPLVGADPRKDIQQVQFMIYPHNAGIPMLVARGRFDPAHFVTGPTRLEEVPRERDMPFRLFDLKDPKTAKVTRFAAIGSDLVITDAGYRLSPVVTHALGINKPRPEDPLMQELLKEVNRSQSLWLAVSFDKLDRIAPLENKTLERYLRPIIRNAQAVQGGITYGTDEVRAEFTFRAKDNDSANKLEQYLKDTCDGAKGAQMLVKDKDLLPLFQLLGTGHGERKGTSMTVRCRLTANQLAVGGKTSK